jgi:CSLREA domain-containing protein
VFPDVPDSNPFHDDIAWLADTGISTGFADGTYRPHDVVSREGMSAFLFRLAEHHELQPQAGTTQEFPDVPPSHLFFGEIGWMANEGIAAGRPDGTFGPAAPVTRDAMAAFLYRYWKMQGPFALENVEFDYPDPGFSDVPTNHPFHDEIAWMAALGVTTGTGSGVFEPGAPVSRQSMAAFLHRLDDRLSAQTIEVSVATDGDDAVVGDGVCEVTAGEGDCSLRAAITEANVTFAEDTITIESGVDPVLSLAGINDDTNATGDLDVLEPVVLDGDGATVDADGIDRVLHIALPDDVPQWPMGSTVTQLTLTGGVLDAGELGDGGGAGILADEARLSLVDVAVSGNDASAFDPTFEAGSAVHLDDHQLDAQGLVVADNLGADLHSAIWAQMGQISLQDSVVRDNGGGVAAVRVDDGSAHLLATTISGHEGHAVLAPDGVVVERSALVDNGLGAYGDDYLDIRQSTIVSEGIAAMSISPDITASTLVTTSDDPTVVVDMGTAELLGSIIAGPSGSPRCAEVIGGEYESAGWNIATDDSCFLTATGDLPSTDPLLEPLADNGGPTPTMLPGEGSPAIDAIPAGTAGVCDATTPTDQRGMPRPSGPGCDVGAVEVEQPFVFVVNTALDGDDADPGDGVCEMTTGAGDCSLRAAISETNALPDADAIQIESGIDPVLSIAGIMEDGNATGDLDVLDDELAIDGSGATVDGAKLDRVFDLFAASEVHISDLTITGGLVSPSDTGTLLNSGGGGINARDSALALNEVALVGNESLAPGDTHGAAITLGAHTQSDLTAVVVEGNTGPAAVYGRSNGLTVVDSVVADNLGGAGIDIFDGSIQLERSVVSGHEDFALTGAETPKTVVDSALVGNGAGIWSTEGGAEVTSSTISNDGPAYSGSDSSSLTAIRSTLVTTGAQPTVTDDTMLLLRATASIIAGPGGLDVCDAPTIDTDQSGGWNLVTDDSCGLDDVTDLPSTDPLLGPVADNGGPTPTMLPGEGSPAIDAIAAGTVGVCDATTPTDQRGVTRPQGPACDIGAVEVEPPPPPLVVNTAVDGDDAVPGDGVCETTAGFGECSLRAAVSEANASPGLTEIEIEPDIDPVLALAGINDDTNAVGDLDVLEPILLEGNGAIVDADTIDRVLHISLPTEVQAAAQESTLVDVTFTGGHLSAAEDIPGGAGVFADGAALSLVDVTITENDSSDRATPPSSDGFGTGLHVAGDDLVAERLVVSDNVGAIEHAGVWVEVGSPQLIDSVVRDNSGRGVAAADGVLSLVRTTVSGHEGMGVAALEVAADRSAVIDNGGGVLAVTGAEIRQSTIDNGGSAVIAGAFEIVASTLVTSIGVPTLDVDGPGTSTLAGSIVAGPAGSDRCEASSGTIQSLGWNIATDDSCDLGATGDQPSTDPLLDPLGDNGGPTLTRLVAALSTAVDAIPAGTVGLCDAAAPTDQRGLARPAGPACDIGAVERQAAD